MKRILRLSMVVLFLLASSVFSYSQNTENTTSDYSMDETRLDKRHWLYFGWAEDHPKAISLMGGAVHPRRPKLLKRDDHSWDYSRVPWHKNSSDPVMFLLSVDNSTHYYPDETNIYRRKIIHWSVAEEYLPFPVSLPYEELTSLWKSSMPNMWNATVKTAVDYEQRGIPGHWLSSGRAIAWKNVYINDGKKIDFSIKQDGNKIFIKISGDNAYGNVVDLPVLKGKRIIKPGNTKEILINIPT